MTIVTLARLRAACMNKPNEKNMASMYTTFETMGDDLGLHLPHRAVHYFCQWMHESLDFRYDVEVWGPTSAQQRYEGRADLGNTVKGDGYKFRGRTGAQLTGRANYTSFMQWAVSRYGSVPNFVGDPDKVNTDPWEGLVPMWYWTSGNPTRKSLNTLADRNDIEMITRRINGGLNGFTDRLERYRRLGLVVLGFDPTAIDAFQAQAKAKGFYKGKVDGLDGPQTRAAIHAWLVDLSSAAKTIDAVALAPVVDEKTVVEEKVVVPPAIDKPIEKTSGFWERVVQITLAIFGAGAAWLQDWRVVLAVAVSVIVVALIGILLHKQILDAAKSFKELRE